jgi:nucleoid-associated protein YgaU
VGAPDGVAGRQAGAGRRSLPLLAWLAALTAGVALFHAMGSGPLAPPPLTDPGAWGTWASGRDPITAVVAVLRLVVLALAWYLVGVTTIGIVARLLRAARLVRLADALTVPAVRRLLQGALGLGLATAMVGAGAPESHGGPAATAAAATVGADDVVHLRRATDEARLVRISGELAEPDAAGAAPPLRLTRVDADEVVRLVQVDAPEDPAASPLPLELLDAATEPAAAHEVAVPEVAVPEAAAPGSTAREVAAPEVAGPAGGPGGRHPVVDRGGPDDPREVGEVGEVTMRVVQEPATRAPATTREVVAGDSLWTIARDTLAAAQGRTPSEAELHHYWQQLIERNRPRLADAENPDLIFPGQVVELPTVPVSPERHP